MKKIIYIALIIITISMPVFSLKAQQVSNETLKQWQKDNDKNVIISPNAASLGIYGSVPISHYTGIPDISIPLYEIDLEGKKIPINLSYHASGIKVAQEASWIGLGWSLNIGGCITREVKGLDDFFIQKGFRSNRGYYYSESLPAITDGTIVPNPDSTGKFDIVRGYAQSDKDGEPDLFRYNFGNHSGNFFFNKNGIDGNTNTCAKAMIVDIKEYLEITFNPVSNKWVATDGYGYKYYFGTTEETTSLSCVYPISQSRPETLSYDNRDESYKTTRSTWMLDSILSPNNRKIIFIYDFEEIKTSPTVSEETSVLLNWTYSSNGTVGMRLPAVDKRFLYSRANIKQAILKQVIFDGGNISLETSGRYDLYQNSPGLPSKLDKIIISNSREQIKSFEFNYKYTGNISSPVSCRLMLDYIKGDDESTYNFYYNKNNLNNFPDKTSTRTDYWGYYSNVDPDPLIRPENFIFTTLPTKLKYIPIKGKTEYLGGSNRHPVERDMKSLILEKIKYPTGGITTFEYEGNKASQEGLELIKLEYVTISGLATDPGNDLANNRLESDPFLIEDESSTITVQMGVYLKTNPHASNVSSCYFFIDKFNENTQFWESYNNAGSFGGLFGHLPENNKNEVKEKILQLDKGKYRFRILLQDGKDIDSYYYRMTFTGSVLKTVNYFEQGKESPLAGLRISKITTTENETGLPIVKNYKYDRNGRSSGILQVVPEFFSKKNEARMIQERDDNNITYEEYGEYFVGRTFPTSTFRLPGSPSIVGYSYVEEITSGNGKTIYEFNNDKDAITGSSLHFPNYPTYSYRLNGTPKKTTVISTSDDTLSITSYKYTYNKVYDNIKGLQYNVNRNQGKSTPDANIYNIAVRIYDISFARNYLEEETITNYYPSTSCFTIKKEYGYNKNNYLVNNIKTKDSRNNSINETIKYPGDYSDNIHTEMAQGHFINYKIEHIKEFNQNKIGHLNINYIKNSSGSFLPGSAQTSFGGELRNDITYDQYDIKGNIRQYTTIDGISTVYLWGYNYQYPIAEFKGVTYLQVETAAKSVFSVASVDALSALATPNETKLKDGSLQKALPGALITTYTYKPLVGMLTATDPSGITTYYDYDSFGRLKETYTYKDNIVSAANKQIVQSYDYHYQNQ